jgi:hypothetical protein
MLQNAAVFQAKGFLTINSFVCWHYRESEQLDTKQEQIFCDKGELKKAVSDKGKCLNFN